MRCVLADCVDIALGGSESKMKVEKNFYDSHQDAKVSGQSSKWSSQQIRICESAWRRDASVRDALFLLLLPLENSYLYTFHSKWGYGLGNATVCYRRGQRTTYTYTKVSSARVAAL